MGPLRDGVFPATAARLKQARLAARNKAGELLALLRKNAPLDVALDANSDLQEALTQWKDLEVPHGESDGGDQP